MPRSSIFGVRGLATAPLEDSQPTTPVGRRVPDPALAAPAHRGGRHHMAHGSASLSQMMPTRPPPMNGASAQAGGRHHYGRMYQQPPTTALQGGVPSEEELADSVVAEMFGEIPETEEILFAEADMLLSDLEDDLDL